MRAIAVLLLMLAGPHAPSADDVLALPEGPVARAWASVGPETMPIEPAAVFAANAPWLLAPGSPIELEERWSAWAAWVERARSAASDPEAVAGLALLALREERWSELWLHMERLGGHPRWLAGLMPACLPGAPLELAPAPGGRAGALDSGMVLTPAPPPLPSTPDPMRPHVRAASVQELTVGETRVALTILVEPSGVQVDVEHKSGPAARLFVRMPAPEGFQISVEYIDWMRQDALRAPLLVELVPGAAPVTLFARGRPRRIALPASPLDELPAALTSAGLLFVPPPGGAALSVLPAAARAFGRALGLPARVGPDTRSDGPAPTVVHLPATAEEQALLLARLCARVETRIFDERARSR